MEPRVMPEVSAHERRIWRLAFLLTGDRTRAARLIDAVLRDQPDPGSVDPARLDRLVILHARDIPHAASNPGPMSDEAGKAMRTLLALPEQPREAWVLTRLDGLDELRVSRAMDCSRKAAARHLRAADEQMSARLGEHAASYVSSLKREADAIDPAPLIVQARELQRKERLGRVLIAAGAAIIVAAGAGVVILRWMT
jgi:hypothetical protein